MEKFSLEQKLVEIRQIVEKMQKGVGDFDQQIALFQQGTDLIGMCRKYLEEAELDIQQMIEGETPDPADADT